MTRAILAGLTEFALTALVIVLVILAVLVPLALSQPDPLEVLRPSEGLPAGAPLPVDDPLALFGGPANASGAGIAVPDQTPLVDQPFIPPRVAAAPPQQPPEQPLARDTQTDRSTQSTQLLQPGQQGQVVFLGLAETDAGVQHHRRRRYTDLGTVLQPLLMKGDHLAHHLGVARLELHCCRRPLHVHQYQARPVGVDDLGHGGIAAECRSRGRGWRCVSASAARIIRRLPPIARRLLRCSRVSTDTPRLLGCTGKRCGRFAASMDPRTTTLPSL